MKYKFNVKITEKDYINFNRDYYKHSKLFLIYIIAFIVIIFIASISNLDETRALFFNIIYSLISTGIPVLLILLLYSLLPIIWKISYRSDRILQEDYTYIFSEKEIYEESNSCHLRCDWNNVAKAIFGKKIIAVFISKQKAFVVPRRYFTSKEEETGFENFINEKLLNKKKRTKLISRKE